MRLYDGKCGKSNNKSNRVLWYLKNFLVDSEQRANKKSLPLSVQTLDTNIPLNALIIYQRDISQSKADDAGRLAPVKESNTAMRNITQ